MSKPDELKIFKTLIGDSDDMLTYSVESNRGVVCICDIDIKKFSWLVTKMMSERDHNIANGLANDAKEAVNQALDSAYQYLQRNENG